MVSQVSVRPADWPLWLPAVASGLAIRRTRRHLLWLLAAGALPGAFGLVQPLRRRFCSTSADRAYLGFH